MTPRITLTHVDFTERLGTRTSRTKGKKNGRGCVTRGKKLQVIYLSVQCDRCRRDDTCLVPRVLTCSNGHLRGCMHAPVSNAYLEVGRASLCLQLQKSLLKDPLGRLTSLGHSESRGTYDEKPIIRRLARACCATRTSSPAMAIRRKAAACSRSTATPSPSV